MLHIIQTCHINFDLRIIDTDWEKQFVNKLMKYLKTRNNKRRKQFTVSDVKWQVLLQVSVHTFYKFSFHNLLVINYIFKTCVTFIWSNNNWNCESDLEKIIINLMKFNQIFANEEQENWKQFTSVRRKVASNIGIFN